MAWWIINITTFATFNFFASLIIWTWIMIFLPILFIVWLISLIKNTPWLAIIGILFINPNPAKAEFVNFTNLNPFILDFVMVKIAGFFILLEAIAVLIVIITALIRKAR